MATATRSPVTDQREAAPAHAPRLPGNLLGIGLGGFVDGIVLHQILQWHHMLSSKGDYPDKTVAGPEANTLADGLFPRLDVDRGRGRNLAALAARRRVALGRERTRLLGWMLAGWGLFNLVEGLVDHEILGLHHVREGSGHAPPGTSRSSRSAPCSCWGMGTGAAGRASLTTRDLLAPCRPRRLPARAGSRRPRLPAGVGSI